MNLKAVYTSADSNVSFKAHPFSQGVLYAFPLLLVVAVYGYAVTMPFFLDDGPHFQILEHTNLIRHWGDFPLFPFYRPLPFTFWKLFHILTGQYDAPFLHMVSVWGYGLSGVILGQIVRVTAPLAIRLSAAVIAGSLFVIFPFAYQAVVMVAAFFHIVLILGILTCLWMALLWLDRRAELWALIGCWTAAFCAVFSHENGVLIVPLLAGILWIKAYRWQTRRAALVLLPVCGIVVLYLVLWISFSPQQDRTLTTALDGAMAMLLQGLIYPAVMMARPLIDGDASAAFLLAFVIAIVFPIVIYAHKRWDKIRWIISYGIGWYLLAIFPASLLLPAGYVLGQPRLALLASVGGSIFWGVILASILRALPWWGIGIASIVGFVLFGFTSLEFLTIRRADFLSLRDFNQEAVRLFEENDTYHTEAVLVNAPDYLTPKPEDRRFLLGTEGVLFVDHTLDYNQQFWMNSHLPYDNITTVAYPQVQRNEGFDFSAHPPVLEGITLFEEVQQAQQLYVTHFYGRAFYPRLVGGIALSGSNEPLVLYPEIGYALTDAQAINDIQNNLMTVSLRWKTDQPEAVKIFIHVYCDAEMIAQSDGYPWGDTYPFSAWQPEEIQTDMRYIELPDNLAIDCLQVYAGLYQEADVTRLIAVNAANSVRFEDDRFPVPLIEISGNTD